MAEVYGAAFGDPTGAHIVIEDVNGIRIRYGATVMLHADMAGNLSLVGNLKIGTAGAISSGATAYGTGTGYWVAYNGGTPQLRVGDPSGNRLAWDGTVLTLVSQRLTINNSGVAIAVPPTGIADDYGFKFNTSFSGTNWVGTFGNEPSSSLRVLNLLNTTNAASKTSSITLQASNAADAAELQLAADHTTGTSYLIATADSFRSVGSVRIGSSAAPSCPLHVTMSAVSDWAAGIVNSSASGYGLFVLAGSSASEYCQLWQTYNGGVNLGRVMGDGKWYNSQNVTTWDTTSDPKAKQNVIPYSSALAKIRQTTIHAFDYTGEFGISAGRGVGVLADDVAAIFPDAVKTTFASRIPETRDADGQIARPGSAPEALRTFNAHELFMANVAATRELADNVDALTVKLAALEAKLAALEER